MPIIVANASGEEILSMGGDPYGTFKVDQFGNTSVSAIPGAMANENFVVAAGSTTQGSVLKYSSNGTTWQDVNLTKTSFTQGFDVGYDGNSTWVASGTAAGGGGVVYSPDSINWTDANNLPFMSAQVAGVCFAPDRRWYAVGYDNNGQNTIIRSDENDPGKWNTYMLSASSAYFDIYSPGNPAVGTSVASDGKNTLVAVGYASPTNSGILWADTKIDGRMWYNATLDDGTTFVPRSDGIAYNGFLWVSTGDYGIVVSVDGKTWKVVATPYQFGGACVGWNGQYWIVGGTSTDIGTPAMFYSYDGFTWEPTSVPGGVQVQAICWNGTYWIAGGQNFGSYVTYSPDAPSASFITSTDAVTWTGTTGLSGASFDVQVNGIANRIRLPNAAPPGATATITGSGAPSLTLGNPGDFYYDKTTFGLYGPKTKSETLGSNGSMFFTSNSGVVSTDPSSDFLLTGDFTIQFWLNAFSNQGSIFAVTTGTGNPGDLGTFLLALTGNSLYLGIDASFDIIPNSVSPYQWSYYNMVRSSTSGLILYSNGSNIYSNAGYATNTIGNLSGELAIGSGIYGNITNFQWVNGYADPSANVVPTAPLTALSGASLLLLAAVDLSAVTEQSVPVFIDSTGNHTMTTTGNVLWSGDNPFQTTTLSWGSATFPPQQRATPNTYTGNGPPVIHPAGSQAGDIYYDISGGGRIKYILT
jgi:hypothetical protein